MNRPVELVYAATRHELAVAAELFREYAAGLPFSLCFQGFEEELATLPGKYATPKGEILLALGDEPAPKTPVGCIALRPLPVLGDGVCEMKRMYVIPAWRGRGVGRLLAERLIADAARFGYSTMKLDSEPDMAAAVALYRSLGFVACERYNDDPHPQTVFMELDLRQLRSSGT